MKATDRERAILFALAAGFIEDWKQAFILSSQKSEKDVTGQKNITTSAERWRRRPEILKAYEKAKKALAEIRQDETAQDEGGRQEGREEERTAAENVRTKRAQAGNIDYYDPQNQRKTINSIIDRSKDDPKTQLDAIKAIQQTQRDDRQAAKDNQVQRFYLPVTCFSCPFKAKQRKKG